MERKTLTVKEASNGYSPEDVLRHGKVKTDSTYKSPKPHFIMKGI